MACFVAPVVEAVVTTIVTKIVREQEEKQDRKETMEGMNHVEHADLIPEEENKIRFSQKLGWLNHMLWGGSILLAFEHVWHGEVVPYFPFLTAATNSEDTVVMLKEITSVGVSMALLVTTVWVVMVIVSSLLERKSHQVNKMNQ